MQLGMVMFNLLDLVWVTRLNLIVGVPDKMFLFGEDVIGPILDKLLSMPMYILVAKHMPPGVEATLFALEMGLSNFGAQTGKYLGVVLLSLLGGVEPPEFVNIEILVVIRALCRLLPILLIPHLVPVGSPRADAFQSAHRDINCTTSSSSTVAAAGPQVAAKESAASAAVDAERDRPKQDVCATAEP
jgi:hypothetical protein